MSQRPPPAAGDRVEMRDPYGSGWLPARVEASVALDGHALVTAQADSGPTLVTWWASHALRAVGEVEP